MKNSYISILLLILILIFEYSARKHYKLKADINYFKYNILLKAFLHGGYFIKYFIDKYRLDIKKSQKIIYARVVFDRQNFLLELGKLELQNYTIAYFLITLIPLLSLINITLIFLDLLLVLLIYFNIFYSLKREFSKRNNTIENEMINFLNILLINILSGQNINLAIEKSISCSKTLQKIFVFLFLDIKHGMEMTKSWEKFYLYNQNDSIRKFSKIILQHYINGDEDIIKNLNALKHSLSIEKTKRIKMNIAQVSQKFMFIGLLQFIGILVSVLLPMMLNFKF